MNKFDNKRLAQKVAALGLCTIDLALQVLRLAKQLAQRLNTSRILSNKQLELCLQAAQHTVLIIIKSGAKAC